MRLLFLIFLVTLLQSPSLAQENPKTATEQVSQFQEQLNSLDTISKRRADGLKNLANKPQEKVNGLARNAAGRITQPIDSLQNKLENTGESIQGKTTEHVQQHLTNLGEKISNPTDSLQTKLNGTTQSIQNETIDPLKQRAESVTDKITNPADSLSRRLNGAIESVQGTIQSPMDSLQRALNFSSPTSKLDMGVPGTDLSIPGATIPELPGATIPSVTSPGLTLPGIEKPGISGAATGMLAAGLPVTTAPGTGLPSPSLQQGIAVPKMELPGIKDINQLNGEFEKAGGQMKQVAEIQGEITSLKQGNLEEIKTVPKFAEAEALKLTEAKGLKAEADKFGMPQEQYKALIEKYRDKKRLEQEIASKVAAIGNEALAKNMPVVNEAQKKMNSARRYYSSFQSVKNLPQKRTNEMKDKPFHERLVPGLNLQIYQSPEVLIDFAPTIGYRFTGRWTAGLAYTFRLGFNDKNPRFISNEHVHGPRVYGQFMVTKGFFLNADFEALQVKSTVANVAESASATVLASYFGLGRGFGITRKVRGSVMALYRYEFSGTLPGQIPFNLRIGFNFVTKKFPKIKMPEAPSPAK